MQTWHSFGNVPRIASPDGSGQGSHCGELKKYQHATDDIMGASAMLQQLKHDPVDDSHHVPTGNTDSRNREQDARSHRASEVVVANRDTLSTDMKQKSRRGERRMVYFSSEMANRAADGVKSYNFDNIIDYYDSYHRQNRNGMQPGIRLRLPNTTPRTCAWCGGRARCACPICLRSLYCGRDCQVKHYPTHGPTCRPAEGASTAIARSRTGIIKNSTTGGASVVEVKSADGIDSVGSKTGRDAFECKFCGKTFKQSSSLKSHARVHTGEKPFSCSLCSKTFSASFALRRHERIHTGEKSYKCPTCNKCFSRKDALKQHERVHTNAFSGPE